HLSFPHTGLHVHLHSFPTRRSSDLDVAHAWAASPKRGSLGKTHIPFKVISNGQEVEVLGTKFNISAYKENKQTYTTLTEGRVRVDRKSTRLNSSHVKISYAVFCLKK